MKLPIDERTVTQCRELAASISSDVQQVIDTHTTLSIERTVLRFLGVEGADGEGVPLINRCVDAAVRAGKLEGGIAREIAERMVLGASSPQVAAEQIAFAAPANAGPMGKISLAGANKESPRAALAQILTPFVERGMERIAYARQTREANRIRLGMPTTPYKYVIVATGNIYDDADQARAAAQAGADIIAVIRSTAQSLIDYVPIGATTEGYGGTWATQENFRIVRQALDDEQEKVGRYLQLVNYSSGLCMPEIAFLAAVERLDMLLNDAMYGILFRDINPRRTLCDQYFSRRIIAAAEIVINTGEDNYLTTADAIEAAHTVLASQFINEAFAKRAGLSESLIGLGHAFEIDKEVEDSFLFELAQAQLVRQIFRDHPIKWMPATKHKTGDIFWSHRVDGLFDLVGVATGQTIELLGMMTEAVANPYLMDRFIALKGARYVYTTARHLGEEIRWNPDGRIVKRAREVLASAHGLLGDVAKQGLFNAIAAGAFADVRRPETGGRGLDGVIVRGPNYFNPVLEALEKREGKA